MASKIKKKVEEIDSKDFERYKKRYTNTKEHFIKEIKTIGLTDPLIFFDDNAMRIDIGYSANEFHDVFPNFTKYDGVFHKIFHPDITVMSSKTPKQIFTKECLSGDYKYALTKEKDRIIENPSNNIISENNKEPLKLGNNQNILLPPVKQKEQPNNNSNQEEGIHQFLTKKNSNEQFTIRLSTMLKDLEYIKIHNNDLTDEAENLIKEIENFQENEDYLCGISQTLMNNPCVLNGATDTNSYERESLLDWLEKKGKEVIGNKKIEKINGSYDSQVTVNFLAKKLMNNAIVKFEEGVENLINKFSPKESNRFQC